MAYFQAEFIQFFQELEQNNQREWFHANKKRYEQFVKNPFRLFVQDLIDALIDMGEEVQIDAKDAIFRINRDIRFSKDKAPYKTHMSALMSAGGKKSMDHPGLYVELNAKEARVYSGAYRLEKDSLQSLREHIAQHQDEFASLISNPDFVAKFGEMQGEKNKRIPKDLVEPAQIQPLIYNKSFYYFASFPAKEILKEDWKETVLDYYATSRPMGEFLLAGIKG
ncbi:MAG: DUF2461 domain-containing protein [Bacteroidota bacterium]